MTQVKDETYEILASLVSEVKEKPLFISAVEIRGKNIIEDLKLDSLDVIKLILLIEERFSIKLPDDLDSLELMNADNMAKYLCERA